MSSDNEEDVFYFESDHIALRGNRDFSNLLRTIAVLEAQKVRAHKHLEELVLAKKHYMEEPDLFLKKIQNNEEVIAPNYMTVTKLPEIGNYDLVSTENVQIKEEPGIGIDKMPTVRGRIFDDTKPETFNQLWTCEEQRRLEELLIVYPTEEFESRRYEKIARALGNRTPQQVCSRVQKYFQKLHNAGMPIPGRKPKIRRTGIMTKTKHVFRSSTFFPAYNVPVHMTDDDDLKSDFYSNMQSPKLSDAANYSADDSSGNMDEIKQQPYVGRQLMLRMLKTIRDVKQNTTDGYNPDPLAPKCEICQLVAVSSIRWRCNTCHCYIKQCSDCLVNQLLTHKFDHITHDVAIEQEI